MRSSLGILVCIALLAGAGCDDSNNVSFYIAGGVVGEVAEGSCEYSVTNALLIRGRLDLGTPCGEPTAARRQYLLFPLYVNQILNRESAGPLRADPNGVFVQGAEIRITDAGGASIGGVGAYTVTASTFVPSALDEVESRQVGVLEIIPAGPATALAALVPNPGDFQTIIVEVQAFGETNGDVSVEAGVFQWPIDLCNGCLYDESSVGADGMTIIGCEPGQDSLSLVACGPVVP